MDRNIWKIFHSVVDELDSDYCMLSNLDIDLMWDKDVKGNMFFACDPLQILRRAYWNVFAFKCHKCGKTFLNKYNECKCVHCGCEDVIGYMPMIFTENQCSLDIADYNNDFESFYRKTSAIKVNNRSDIENKIVSGKYDPDVIIQSSEFEFMVNCVDYLRKAGIESASCVISGLTGKTRLYINFLQYIGFAISNVYSNECTACGEIFLSKSPADCCQRCGYVELISNKVDSKFNTNLLKENPEPPLSEILENN